MCIFMFKFTFLLLVGANITAQILESNGNGCSSEENSCLLEIGSSLPTQSMNFSVFEISSGNSLYFYFNIPRSSLIVDVTTTMFYGNVQILSDIGRNHFSSQDYNGILTIQITDTKEQIGKIHIVAVTNSILRVSLSAPETVMRIEEGIPVLSRVHTTHSLSTPVLPSQSFEFYPTSNLPISLGVTFLSGAGKSSLRVIGPSAGDDGVSRNWTMVRQGSNGLVVSLTPTAQEVGNLFRVILTAENVTGSLLGYMDCSLVLSSHSTDSPTHLPGDHFLVDSVGDMGQAECISGNSAICSSQYYIFHAPPGKEDALIVISPFYGNPDLYVNPCSKGFFRAGSSSLATWQSTETRGSDAVLIEHSHPAFQSQGGAYCVTVTASRSSEFFLMGKDAATVIRLAEGAPVLDIISGGSYHYYTFTDTSGIGIISPEGTVDTSSIVFDVTSKSGNPNLLVGCQIVPTGDTSGYPSDARGHFNFSSGYEGEDSIVITAGDRKRCVDGVYYVAVYARQSCVFSLTASHLGGIITLHDGVTVQGTAYARVNLEYRFYMGWEKQQLTVTLSPESGDVDLVVFEGEYVFWANRPGPLTEVVVVREDAMCDRCTVSIVVKGVSRSRFSLVASLKDTPLALRNGVPMTEDVAASNIQYFTLHPPLNGTAYVVVTALSGQPILYVSNTATSPTDSTDNVCVDSRSSLGLVAYCSFPHNVNMGTIYIGVGGGYSNSSFSVRGSVDRIDRPPVYSLQYGLPQNDVVGEAVGSQWRFYPIIRTAGHDSIVIRALALSGSVDLYISKCPVPDTAVCIQGSVNGTSYYPSLDNYLMTSKGREEDSIVITRLSNDFTNTIYLIGVHSADRSAEFQVSVHLEESVLMLQPGVAVMDQVWKGEEDYFGIYVSSSQRQILKISFTPIDARDAVLSVTTDKRGASNSSGYAMRQQTHGETVIRIDTEEYGACVACTYYITVSGIMECKYSLVATVGTTVGRVQDGQPFLDSVEAGEYAKYVFKDDYGVGRDLQIVFEVQSGGAALFVTFDGTPPTSDNYALRSPPESLSDRIIITRSDIVYEPCVHKECFVRMSILGGSDYPSSVFRLSITSSAQNTELRLGIPYRAKLSANTENYFKMSMDTKSAHVLRLSVVELSGNVEVFVSCHSSFPNSSHFDWRFSPRNDVLFDISNSKGKCINQTTYYVTVAASDEPALYSILGNALDNSSAISYLTPGSVYVNRVDYHRFVYYFLRPDIVTARYEDTRIIVGAAWGDVDVYVSASWAERPYYSGDTGRVESYKMKSAAVGGEDVTLPGQDIIEMCRHKSTDDRSSSRSGGDESPCAIVIGVFGVYSADGPGTDFRIQASTSDSMVVLSTGFSIRGSLKPHHSHFYKYTVSSVGNDVSLTLTSLRGDADLLVAMKPIYHPSPENYTWASVNWGEDTITIQASQLADLCSRYDTDLLSCDLFITVFAAVNSSYSLVASVGNGFRSPITLIDGQPQNGRVNLGGYQYYDFYISASELSDRIITVAASPVEHSAVDMYVTLGGEDSEDSEPGPNQYHYASTSYLGVTEEVLVTPQMPHYCSSCVMHIAVRGKLAGQFSIVASSSGYSEIASGRPVGGHLSSGSYRYYYMRNTHPLAELSITLTPFHGDPDLCVNAFDDSKNNNVLVLPTMQLSMWQASSDRTDTLTINYADENFCSNCLYVIGVYAFQNATYTLLVSNSKDAVISIYPSKPQRVTVAEPGKRFFRFSSQSSVEDFSLSFTKVGSGSLRIFALVCDQSAYNGTLPDPSKPSTYTYSSTSPNDVITIHGPHPTPIVVAITVVASSAMSYTALVSTTKRPILLQAGFPQIHFMGDQSMALFTFYLSEVEDLQLTMTVLAGEPAMLVSENKWFPACSENRYHQLICENYTWAASKGDSQQIVISKDFPCRAIVSGTRILNCHPEDFKVGEIHIGVFGYMSSRFSLTATPMSKHVVLSAGVSQTASTSAGYMCSKRSSGNGACDVNAREIHAQIAYFTLTVGSSSSSHGPEWDSLLISVHPICDALDPVCRPGCEDICSPSKKKNTAPLEVFVSSCLKSQCTAMNRFPSVFSGSETLRITTHIAGVEVIFDGDSEYGYCQPTSNEMCQYYIAVISQGVDATASFSISSTHFGDVQHIPCDDYPNNPDGIRRTNIHSLQPPSSSNAVSSMTQQYELCTGRKSDEGRILVSVEQCSGNFELFICEDSVDNLVCVDFLPSPDSWEYRATLQSTCHRQIEVSGGSPLEVCEHKEGQFESKPLVSLPLAGHNYHLLVSGRGSYFVQVQHTTILGRPLGPSLSIHAAQSVQDVKLETVSVSGVTDSSFVVHWAETYIRGGLSQSASIPFEGIHYHLYLVDTAALHTSRDLVLNTLCGFEYALSVYPSLIRKLLLPQPTSSGFAVTGLHKDTSYVAYILSTCDGECLRLFSKVHPSSGSSCAGSRTCSDLMQVYDPVQVVTLAEASPNESRSKDNNVVAVAIFATISFVFALMMYAKYCRSKYTNGFQSSTFDESSYEMSDFSENRKHWGSMSREGLQFDYEEEEELGDEKDASAPHKSVDGRGTYQAPDISGATGGGQARGFLSKLTPTLGKGVNRLVMSPGYMHVDRDDEDEITVTL